MNNISNIILDLQKIDIINQFFTKEDLKRIINEENAEVLNNLHSDLLDYKYIFSNKISSDIESTEKKNEYYEQIRKDSLEEITITLKTKENIETFFKGITKTNSKAVKKLLESYYPSYYPGIENDDYIGIIESLKTKENIETFFEGINDENVEILIQNKHYIPNLIIALKKPENIKLFLEKIKTQIKISLDIEKSFSIYSLNELNKTCKFDAIIKNLVEKDQFNERNLNRLLMFPYDLDWALISGFNLKKEELSSLKNKLKSSYKIIISFLKTEEKVKLLLNKIENQDIIKAFDLIKNYSILIALNSKQDFDLFLKNITEEKMKIFNNFENQGLIIKILVENNQFNKENFEKLLSFTEEELNDFNSNFAFNNSKEENKKILFEALIKIQNNIIELTDLDKTTQGFARV